MEWQPTPVFFPGEFHGQIFFNVATRRVKITLCGLHIYVLHVIFLLNGDVVDVYLYIQDRGFRSFNGYMEHIE